jgi:predicted amidohydrolase
MLVDPRGDMVVEAGDDDAVVVGEVSVDLVDEARAENPSLLNRRDAEPWPRRS